MLPPFLRAFLFIFQRWEKSRLDIIIVVVVEVVVVSGGGSGSGSDGSSRGFFRSRSSTQGPIKGPLWNEAKIAWRPGLLSELCELLDPQTEVLEVLRVGWSSPIPT